MHVFGRESDMIMIRWLAQMCRIIVRSEMGNPPRIASETPSFVIFQCQNQTEHERVRCDTKPNLEMERTAKEQTRNQEKYRADLVYL